MSLPHAVRLRDATAHRLTRGQLRGARWERLSLGLYARRDPGRTLAELAQAVGEVLPRESGFGHLTSAALRGWWLPNRLPAHVLLATTRSEVHIQRPGIYVRRSDLAEFEPVDGVRCVTAAHTLVELARDLPLVDLVPMIDAALGAGMDPDELTALCRHPNRGVRTLRHALALADGRSESWWESILRLQHVLTGLGPVDSQVELSCDGRFVARADLHLVGTNRYPECDGGDHRDKDRHLADLARDKGMARLGAQRFGYTTAEIAYRPELVIRDAEQARGLPHDPRRTDDWWAYARPSTLTAGGRRRLAERLDRYRRAADR